MLADRSYSVVTENEAIKKQKLAKPIRARSPWMIFIVFIASAVSVGATMYYFNKSEILLYNDSLAHLLKARGVYDSLTPGFEQMGDAWLPFQHVLMLPFIWNDWLWQTGLAGVFPSMFCYIVAAIYLFCTLRRITKQAVMSFIGVLIFLFNPNILYLQSTPLTEVMCLAASISTAYYLLCWLQEGKPRYIAYTAITTSIATLIRYDGWALFIVVTVILVSTLVFRKQDRDMVIDHLMGYLSIASFGIVFWLIWNAKLSGDPLYFYRGQYSAQAYQLYFLQKGELLSYHNIVSSFRIYVVDVGQTIGWGLFIAALLALSLILIVCRKRQDYYIIAVLLIPFAFYVMSLYMGSSIIELPGVGNNTFFNVRYGAQMVLPAAFLVARAGALLYAQVRRLPLKAIFVIACIICIAVQVESINTSGILSLQDGLVGISCNNPSEPVILSLAQHYNGGRILVDEYTSVINPELFGAHFSDIVYEGSGAYWRYALVHPAKSAQWVVLNPHTQGDVVAKLFNKNKTEFLSSFKLISSNPNGLQLYYKINAPPLPTRSIPNDLLNRPHTCKLNE